MEQGGCVLCRVELEVGDWHMLQFLKASPIIPWSTVRASCKYGLLALIFPDMSSKFLTPLNIGLAFS